MNYYAVYRVDTKAEIEKLTIGDHECSKIETLGMDDDKVKISRQFPEFINCTVDKNIEAGYYDASFQTTAGYPRIYPSMYSIGIATNI